MAEILIDEAPLWGITLEHGDGKLTIYPASKAPPELKALLREHKAEMLERTEALERKTLDGIWRVYAADV
jgi:hypothetical protein